ncbi:MAG: transcriptional regulator [Acidobacteria bacterium]|nr:MAG: transcriptional regulator [Acidobacteriota bacterium]
MFADAAIAPVASLLADPARVAILFALSDGREISASELALTAGVTAPTASVHLARLVEGGLVDVRPEGRHRYYRLARPELIQAMEALAVLAPPATPRTHRQARIGRAVRAARTCYDHLAGRLGVGLTAALVDRGALRPAGVELEVTPEGVRFFEDFGIDVEAARARRRGFAPACLDWSERLPHLAGSLGAALLARLFDLGWLERTPGSRAVQITLDGRRGFSQTFGVES